MNMENITLRPLTRKDYPALEAIIRKTWKYDSLSGNPVDAKHMGRLYLRSCLKRAGFACVAVYHAKDPAASGEGNGSIPSSGNGDDRTLGVILARSKNARPGFFTRLSRSFEQFYAGFLLLSTRSGRKIAKLFGGFDEVDTQLLTDSGRQFDGEICLFAMAEEARGLGIGKKLFAKAQEWLQAQNARSFYLFTDSSCTYQFYEKRGLKRLQEKTLDFRPRVDYQLHMFLYSGSVS